MFKTIYKCEDFMVDVVNKTLTIWGAELIGMAKDVDDFNNMYKHFCPDKETVPNAVICPELYCQQKGINMVVFEK